MSILRLQECDSFSRSGEFANEPLPIGPVIQRLTGGGNSYYFCLDFMDSEFWRPTPVLAAERMVGHEKMRVTARG